MEFDPTLKLADIMLLFGCTKYRARRFIRDYGFKMGRTYAISQRKVRFLQMDGTAAAYFAGRIKK